MHEMLFIIIYLAECHSDHDQISSDPLRGALYGRGKVGVGIGTSAMKPHDISDSRGDLGLE